MAEHQYLIVANGDWPGIELLRSLTESSSKIIACDGAAEQCIEEKIPFDVVIGDMDSLSEKFKSQLNQRNDIQFITQEGQHENDLVKAMKWAIEDGAEHIDVVGVEGGEIDHQFAAIMALCEVQFSARIHTSKSTVELIEKSGYQNTSLLKGSTFSLFAVGEVKGLSVTGCKWNLENKSMHPSTHGLHNVVTENRLEIQYKSGLLLLFLNR
tara:strand:- start:15868 stop:16500 length:633 start_codon:yes stop_codon:yes gene_type:complete